MKSIIFAILILYSLGLTYHDPKVAYVGDKSDVAGLQKQKSSSSGLQIRQFQNQDKELQAPHVLKLIHEKEFQDDFQWKATQNSSEIYPRQWQTNYTINFKTSCTKSPATLRLTSTGQFEVYLQDKLIQSKHKPWPQVTKINLTLKCGENNIKIVVFNKEPSPAAIIYALTQNISECFKCKFAQLFNNQTCSCGCPQQQKCYNNQIFNKEQCKCVSICEKKDQCAKNKTWDADICQCVCQKKQEKCTENAKWNANSCDCQCVDKAKCIEGYQWDNKLCKCVSSQPGKKDHKSQKLTTDATKGHQPLSQPTQD